MGWKVDNPDLPELREEINQTMGLEKLPNCPMAAESRDFCESAGIMRPAL